MAWEALCEPTKDERRSLQKGQRKAKYLVDENLGKGVTEFLRCLKQSVEDITEIGLSGRPDEAVFSYARKKNLVLLTHDDDFLGKRFELKLSPGVFILPGGSGKKGDEEILIRAIVKVLKIVGPFRNDWFKTKVEIESNGIWNVYRLEHSSGQTKTRYKIPIYGMPLMEKK